MITFISSTGGSKVSPYTIPSVACQAGDLILIHFEAYTNIGVTSYPSGFFLILGYNSSNISHYLYGKIATSSEPSGYTFEINPATTIYYEIFCFRGVDQNNPIVSTRRDSGYGSTINLSKLSLSQGTMVMAFFAKSKIGGTITSLNNWVSNWSDGYRSVYRQVYGGATETENPIAFSNSASDEYWDCFLIELKDANPFLDMIFINWLLTDEPGSKLWVKINGEWKPAKITII
jgi:hypothetical protein